MEVVRVPISRRPGDLLLALFFITQFPLVVILDAQMLLPKRWFPTGAQNLLQWHVDSVGDYLVRDVPPFYRALVACQIFMQVPFDIALGYAFLTGQLKGNSTSWTMWSSKHHVDALLVSQGKQWGRMAGIIWGVHTATTMIPILGDILASQERSRNTMLAIYVPYLVIPLVVVARLLPWAEPFAAASGQLQDKKAR